MKKNLFTLLMLVVAISAYSQQMADLIDEQVILNGNLLRPHLLEAHEPMATIVSNRQKNLVIRLDPLHYSSYTITVTPSDGSNSTTVSATSTTVTVPITNNTLDYLVTVDGGDYGLYDGVFNTRGDSVTLTDALAHRLVMNRRTVNDSVRFYSATVNHIINDDCCPIDTMPAAAWATDTNINKHLIITDERNANYTYYYFPESLSIADTIPYINLHGIGISHNTLLKPLNSPVSPSWQKHVSFSPNSSTGNPYGNDIWVIIYMEGNYGIEDYLLKWNESAAFYSLMTQKFEIPKSNIFVSGYRIEELYNVEPGYSHDFDCDGIDEITGRLEWNEIIDSLRNESFEQLVVFYGGNIYARNFNDTSSWWDIDLPKNLPSEINANFFHYILSTGQATHYTQDYADKNAVVTCLTDSWEALDNYFNNDYYNGSYFWLSALAGENISTHELLPNYGESMSLHSILDLSNIIMTHESHDPEYFHQPLSDISNPESLHDSIGFDIGFPETSRLMIRQLNESMPACIDWDSPDIWLRSTNDGETNQSYECIKVTSNKKVYVNVRVWNMGSKTYTGGEYVHLFWEHPHLGVPGVYSEYDDLWVPQMPNYIGSIQLNDTILPNQSKVFSYQWTLPSDVQTMNSFLAVNLSAWISNGAYDSSINLNYDRAYARRKKLVRNNHVVVHYDILPNRFEYVSPSDIYLYKEGDFEMTMYSERLGHDWLDIALISDSILSNGNIFNSDMQIYSKNYFTWYQDTINVTQLDDDGRVLQLNGLNSKLLGVYVNLDGDQVISLGGKIGLYGYGNQAIPGVSHLMHIAATDSQNRLREGQSVRFVIPEYTPSGGGMTPFPLGIRATSNGNGMVTLSETNVSEPAAYEWYSIEQNKFAEGKTVIANKNEIGNIAVLKVTKSANGQEQYAVTSLDATPAIASVSPVPFIDNICIQLTDNALAGMSVRIVPVINAVSPIEQGIAEGSSSVTVVTASLPAGQYVLCLLHNNVVVQSLNVYKSN